MDGEEIRRLTARTAAAVQRIVYDMNIATRVVGREFSVTENRRRRNRPETLRPLYSQSLAISGERPRPCRRRSTEGEGAHLVRSISQV